jgi:hypothetical protein
MTDSYQFPKLLAGIIGLIISDKKVALTTKLKLFYLAATYLWICLKKKI